VEDFYRINSCSATYETRLKMGILAATNLVAGLKKRGDGSSVSF
jgi:hypothetical protein